MGLPCGSEEAQMGWLMRFLGLERDKGNDLSVTPKTLADFEERERRIKAAGAVNGKHYTDHVERVKWLKREKRHEEAIALLLDLVTATERESQVAGKGWGVAPWYYEQLAIIYRKEKRFDDEVAILERYQLQTKAPGAGPSKLAERLEKARALRDRSET